jgi:diadenosine tetraphosphate (Ap4A) HIT family hydrolase
MTTLIHRRVEAARSGENRTVICRMPSGWAVLGDSQFLRGYSLLLPDPVVPGLNSLTEQERVRYLLDMSIIGDALLEVTGAYRINYEILCNTEPALHAHVTPRYLSEPDEFRKGPAWFYKFDSKKHEFDPERDRELISQIAQAIQQRLDGGKHENT